MATNVGTLSVHVGAEIRNLTVGLKRATAEVRTFSAKTQGYMQANATAVRMLRRAFIALGVGIAVGVGFAIKSFADLEQGYIEVAKRTGFAGDVLEEFKKRLEALSLTMAGVSIRELQSIAATAGQLGIEGADNILTFTEAIAKMAVATDLSADEASLALAKIVTIMGEAVEDTERLGSVINELSNTTEATASDIAELTRRIGGAGKTIGLTSAEVMGLSATLVATGARIQEGGTAISQVLLKMLTNTEAFASASGVAFEEYTQMIRDNPIEAVKALIKNLASMEKFKRAEALKGLGLEGQRVGGTLLRLAGAVDKLEKNLSAANREWKEGTSLQKEYDVASNSMKAQFVRVKDSVVILAAKIGEELRPEIMEAMKLFREFTTEMGESGEAIKVAGGAVATVMRGAIRFILGSAMAWNEVKIGINNVQMGIENLAIAMARLRLKQTPAFFKGIRAGIEEGIKTHKAALDETIKKTDVLRDINADLMKLRDDLSDESIRGLKATKDATDEQTKSDEKGAKAIRAKAQASADATRTAKKDLLTEMIGAFGWKPPAMAMGMASPGGFGTPALAGNIGMGSGAMGRGTMVLNLQVNVENAREAGRRVEQAITELGVTRD